MSNLEHAALSGELFSQESGSAQSRSQSPSQSPSLTGSDVSRSSTPNTDPSTIHKSSRPRSVSYSGPGAGAGAGAGGTAGGNGGGLEDEDEARGAKTGPKGVIADRASKVRETRLASEHAKREYTRYQESRGMSAMTVHEEDEARQAEQRAGEAQAGEAQDQGQGAGQGEDEEVAKWRSFRRRELQKEHFLEGGGDLFPSGVGGGIKRGGLREVGQEGFLHAVEGAGWVVVLIYEPDIARCDALLASTLALALSLPPSSNVTLLRARATSLQFSLLKDTDPEDGPRADPDVLPTLLAYKNGELEKTWVRVDWEVGQDGVEGLLKREEILPKSFEVKFNQLNVDSDEEDEDEGDI